VAKSIVVCVEFLPNVARQNILKSANAAQSYSKNKNGTFYGPRCINLEEQYLSIDFNIILRSVFIVPPISLVNHSLYYTEEH